MRWYVTCIYMIIWFSLRIKAIVDSWRARWVFINHGLFDWWFVRQSYPLPFRAAIHPWLRHQMENFSAILAICAGNSPVHSSQKGQWRGALMFSLICDWINGWVNNREAGDLWCYRTHYNVTVMQDIWSLSSEVSSERMKPCNLEIVRSNGTQRGWYR